MECIILSRFNNDNKASSSHYSIITTLISCLFEYEIASGSVNINSRLLYISNRCNAGMHPTVLLPPDSRIVHSILVERPNHGNLPIIRRPHFLTGAEVPVELLSLIAPATLSRVTCSAADSASLVTPNSSAS